MSTNEFFLLGNAASLPLKPEESCGKNTILKDSCNTGILQVNSPSRIPVTQYSIIPGSIDWNEFFSSVLGAAQNDKVGLALVNYNNKQALTLAATCSLFQTQPKTFEDNVFFNAAVLDGNGFKTENAIKTGSVIFDLDYGASGHKQQSPFPDYQAALDHLSNMQILPSKLWHTGHGFQGVFLINKSIYFNDQKQVEDYTEVKTRVYAICRSDKTSAAANLFRLPTSMNSKPNCPSVKSYFIWNTDKKYSMEEILSTLPPAIECKAKVKKSNGVKKKKLAVEDDPYLSIEEARQRALALKLPIGVIEECLKPAQEGSRSTSFDKAVLSLVSHFVRLGDIVKILSANPAFTEKYSGRFKSEVERSYSKHIQSEYEDCKEIKSFNRKMEFPLESYSPAEFNRLYGNWLQKLQIPEYEKFRYSFHLFDNVTSEHSAAVLEACCGFGKSTWILINSLTRAAVDERMVIVVKTRAEARRIRDLLNTCTAGIAGVYLGFSKTECTQTEKWKNAKRVKIQGPRRTICKECAGKCEYWHSPDELESRNVIVTTQSCFFILAQKEPDIIEEMSVYLDEDIDCLFSERFTKDEIKSLASLLHGINPDMWRQFNNIFSFLRMTGGNVDFLPGSRGANLFTFAGNFNSLRTWLVLKFSKISDLQLDLLVRFLRFFSWRGTYGVTVENDEVKMMRDRIDIAGFKAKKFYIFNATASFSLTRFNPGIPICGCSALNTMFSKGVAELHVFVNNPTKSNRPSAVDLLADIDIKNPAGSKMNVLAVENKDAAEFCATAKQHFTKKSEGAAGFSFTTASRGLVRGGNAWRECNVFISVTAGFFPGVGTSLLTAALVYGRSISEDEVYSITGLRMTHGEFCCEELQDVFIRTYASDLYQAIHRTAIRDDHNVTAVVAVHNIGLIFELANLMKFKIIEVYGSSKRAFRFRKLANLLNTSSEYFKVTKKKVAELLGYSSYKNNKQRIRKIMQGNFIESERYFVRKT